MGSPLRLIVIGGSARDARAARNAAWAELAAVDHQLSRFRSASALSRANAAVGSRVWVDAAQRLRRLVALAWRAQRATDGRFDARVIHVLERLGEHAGVDLPSGDPSVVRWLERDGRSPRVRFASPVDSGGLGKGLGLRWAIAKARVAAPRVNGLLLEAGGDVALDGPGPNRGTWSIGIEDPRRPGALMATVALTGGAIATSSTAVRSWTLDDRTVHHLIDPARAEPADSGLLAVSVAVADPAWAEVWSKALFLAGRANIGPEARRRGQAVWWVEKDGSLHMTPAARQLTTWIRDEASAA
jgi:thiamine biosynthesis lipoprotein